MTRTYASAQAEGLATAHKLVEAWGAAYYAAAYRGRKADGVTVDGENVVEAMLRWIELVAGARDLAAAKDFGAIAMDYLEARFDRGRVARDAEARPTFSSGIAVGVMVERVRLAEAALREAATPLAQPDSE